MISLLVRQNSSTSANIPTHVNRVMDHQSIRSNLRFRNAQLSRFQRINFQCELLQPQKHPFRQSCRRSRSVRGKKKRKKKNLVPASWRLCCWRSSRRAFSLRSSTSLASSRFFSSRFCLSSSFSSSSRTALFSSSSTRASTLSIFRSNASIFRFTASSSTCSFGASAKPSKDQKQANKQKQRSTNQTFVVVVVAFHRAPTLNTYKIYRPWKKRRRTIETKNFQSQQFPGQFFRVSDCFRAQMPQKMRFYSNQSLSFALKVIDEALSTITSQKTPGERAFKFLPKTTTRWFSSLRPTHSDSFRLLTSRMMIRTKLVVSSWVPSSFNQHIFCFSNFLFDLLCKNRMKCVNHFCETTLLHFFLTVKKKKKKWNKKLETFWRNIINHCAMSMRLFSQTVRKHKCWIEREKKNKKRTKTIIFNRCQTQPNEATTKCLDALPLFLHKIRKSYPCWLLHQEQSSELPQSTTNTPHACNFLQKIKKTKSFAKNQTFAFSEGHW